MLFFFLLQCRSRLPLTDSKGEKKSAGQVKSSFIKGDILHFLLKCPALIVVRDSNMYGFDLVCHFLRS